MSDIPSHLLRPPPSPEVFEDLVRDLFARRWGDPNAKRFGRSGQGQQGVDIVGQPADLSGGYAGVQCKRYEDGTLRQRTIVEEVGKADTFPVPLTEYTIATSARRDASLQASVLVMNQERVSAGKFAVQLAFWDDLASELALPDNQDLVHKYFPELRVLLGTPTTPYKGLAAPDRARLFAEYRDYLRRQFGDVPLVGIAPRVQDRLLEIPLDTLFVPMQAEPDGALAAGFVEGYAGLQRTSQQASARLVDLHQVMSAHRAVLLGEPGAGKSTCLRWLLQQVLLPGAPQPVGDGDPESLPFFVRLAHFAAVLEGRPALGLADYLREAYLPEYNALFAILRTDSTGWLLLDGLDEIAEPRLRIQVRDAIESFALQFPRFHLIVTSRLVGYRAALLRGSFRRFTLQPFGPDAIATFARNWYHAVIPDPLEAAQRAERLLRGLRDNPRVRLLAGTPLLLAIIVLMDWKGKAIPRRRADLLEVATQTLLEDWPREQGRPIGEAPPVQLALRLLAPVAYEMLASSTSQAIRRDQLNDLIASLMQALRGYSEWEARESTERWLNLLNEHSGLLSEVGTESAHPVFAFLHRSFAEYLAGRHLVDLWRGSRLELTRHTNDPRWHEPLRLMAAQLGRAEASPEATKLVEEIIALRPPHDDVLHQTRVLAAQCLADDVRIAGNLRSEILDEVVRFWYREAVGRLRSKMFRIMAAMQDTQSAGEILERISPLLDDAPSWACASSHELLGYLGQATDPVVRERLVGALQRSDIEVQRAAARAMDLLGLAVNPEARAALFKALQHPDVRVRAPVVLALRSVVEHDAESRRLICDRLIHDDHYNVRRMAVLALQSIRQPGQDVLNTMITAVIGDSGVRGDAISCFRWWGQSPSEHLARALGRAIRDAPAERYAEVAHALIGLGSLGPTAVSLLSEVAEGDGPMEYRLAAVTGFGLYPSADARVLDVLVRLLKAENRGIQHRALKSLERLRVREQRVSRALLPNLTADDPRTRRMAAETLALCGTVDLETIAALARALTDNDELVSLYAAGAAAKLGVLTASAEARLVAALTSRTGDARRRAIESLQEMAGHLPRSVVAAVAALGDERKEKDPEVRAEAIRLLGERGRTTEELVVTACRAALTDVDKRVRLRAAEALGQVGDTTPPTIRALLAALADKDNKVRLEASTTLILMSEGAERARIVAQLRDLLDEHPDVGETFDTLWGIIIGE